ncbi:MAG: DsbA family protein [Myxococcales bacterium]|nr:DsbA family protein [Myxococcales bacterium]
MRSSLLVLALSLVACTRSQPVVTAPPLPTVRVDVWHDTICPWCRIGLHTLDTVVAETKDVRVDVVHHAFLLDRLDAMFERVSAAGAPYGVRFAWDKVRVSPDTTASHVLLAWAPVEQRAGLLEAIHRAHFEDGKNLGDVDVLAGLARARGLDADAARAALNDPARRAAARAEAAAATTRGITGVPHFVIGGQSLNGAQSPQALAAAIRASTK